MQTYESFLPLAQCKWAIAPPAYQASFSKAGFKTFQEVIWILWFIVQDACSLSEQVHCIERRKRRSSRYSCATRNKIEILQVLATVQMSRSSTARLLARLKTEGPVAPPNPQETNTNKPKRNRKRKRKDDNTLVVEKKQKEEMAEAENLPAVSIPPEPQPEQVVDSVSIPSEPQPEQAVDTVTYLPSFKGLHHDTTNYTSINFLKNVKWYVLLHSILIIRSPDGRCFLTNSEDHILRLYDR